MILDKEVEVKVVPKTFKHYRDKGYVVKSMKMLIIKVDDLTLGSHVEISVKCDEELCGTIKKTTYKEYIKNTKNFIKPYCCQNCCGEKRKKTNLENNGTEFPSQNKEIYNKVQKTNLIKYGGVAPMCDVRTKDKLKQTCKEKYGAEHHFKNEKVKEKIEQTCLENFGFKNASQNEFIKNKKIETCLKNYGVEHPSQDPGLHEKAQINAFKLKSHEQTGLKYRGKNELHFIDYCFGKKICVEKASSIRYEFENKNRIYHPDFYLREKKLIIEIKSTYTMNIDYEENVAKQKACIEQGYNFIFIIDFNYDEFVSKYINI